jgi:hypothetical protein
MSLPTVTPRRLACVAVVVLSAHGVGCDRKGSVELAPAAQSLAVSSAEPGAATWNYTISPKGGVHVELPGLKERITGDATAAGGALEVAPRDLSKSRGQVRVDLATFSTTTFGSDKDATQTKHARTWLEVQVGDKTNEDMRYAEFAIRAIDGLSATDLSLVAPAKDGPDDVRAVTMTVHGELLVHGHRVPKDDVVEVAFRYAAGAPADSRPNSLQITSKGPLRVVLKEHDVRPRDPAGQLLEWTTNLLSKVADTADVTVRLSATPAT